MGWIYVIFFTVIFLESALLPAAFLPGDSLLLLAGALIAKGILPFYPTLGLLVAATGIGYWLNYLLGRWLSHTKPIQKWLSGVPAHTHQQANALSERYGPLALLFGRFLGFVRTLLPLLVGISGLRSGKFQLFNWLGALLWVYALMTAGGALTDIPLFRDNEAQGMSLLLILPVMLLVVGIATSIIIAQQRRRQNKGKKKLDE
ncbi:DedA family protein [Yersinia intermedia]|nr:DedA family protein [Yersinia intermedia]